MPELTLGDPLSGAEIKQMIRDKARKVPKWRLYPRGWTCLCWIYREIRY